MGVRGAVPTDRGRGRCDSCARRPGRENGWSPRVPYRTPGDPTSAPWERASRAGGGLPAEQSRRMRLAVRAASGILFAARHGYHFHPVELPDQPPPGTITLLLERSRKGEAAARDDLYRHIERDLRAMARRQLAGSPADPLMQATMLVNEACERLLERHASIQDRRHLFFLLSRAMHDVLVEHVRRQVSIKRGGGARRVPLTALDLVDGGAGDAGEREVAALREALDALAEVDPDGAEMIRLRFYCGRSPSSRPTAACTRPSRRC